MVEQNSPRRSLSIGITIGLSSASETLWNNGIKQNALYLARLLQNSPLGHRVTLFNTTHIDLSEGLAWDILAFPTRRFQDGCDGLDVLIELGGQISAEQTASIKAQGTKLVSYCCGPEYVQTIEAMIFSRPLYNSIFINQHYDALWIIPQIWELNRGFLQTLRRSRLQKVPFVWHPMAIEAALQDHPGQGLYQPRSEPKRLTVIEPNIDVLKFCLYPILIAEQAFRQAPDAISFLHVANAERFVHEEREFAALMRQLDIVQAHKASFIGRVVTPHFLAEHSDIVISHQWGLPLNYFYLECCWLGYPLIHNAELIAELGYYYTGSEVEEGAALLVEALLQHDQGAEEYRARQRQQIWRFHADNPELAAAYDDLLFELLGG